MPRATALETIIRQCSKDQIHLKPNQVFVTYDHKNGAIADATPGFFQNWFGGTDFSHFIITSGETITIQGPRNTLTSSDKGQKMLLDLTCKVTSVPGKEHELVESLAHARSPESALKTIVKNCFENAVEETMAANPDLFFKFFDLQEKLETLIEGGIEKQTGLKAIVEFSVIGSQNVESDIDLKSDLIPVYVPSDRDLRLTVEITTNLRRKPGTKNRVLQVVTRGTPVRCLVLAYVHWCQTVFLESHRR